MKKVPYDSPFKKGTLNNPGVNSEESQKRRSVKLNNKRKLAKPSI